MKMTIDLDISLVSIAHIKTNMTVIASDEQSGGYVEELRNQKSLPQAPGAV